MSQEDFEALDIVIADGYTPMDQRMIIIKQLANGDIHAENNMGEMIIINREDGLVRTFLDGDTQWMYGRLENFGEAWETIGVHFGMTLGHAMERTRNEPQTN